MVYDTVTFEDGTYVKTAIGAFVRLNVTGNNPTPINTPITLTVEYVDYEGNKLNNENTPIEITVKEQGSLTLTPVNGAAVFDFESPVAGTFGITALGQGITCNEGRIEVTVSEP
jgi:hypothetical protein